MELYMELYMPLEAYKGANLRAIGQSYPLHYI